MEATPLEIKADNTPTPVTATAMPTPRMLSNENTEFPSFDLDSLIPKNLREATEKLEAAELPPETPVVRQTPAQAAAPNDPITPPPADEPDLLSEADKIAQKINPTPTDDTQAEDQAPPFWTENESYKELMNHLNYSGVPKSLLTKFAEEISSHQTVDTTKLVGGLEQERADLRADVENLQSEVLRLREIEREAVFDNHPETEDKYSKPMINSATAIRSILDLEGSKVPLADILNAPNKTELLRVIRDMDLSDSDVQTLTSQWRTYKETQKDYEVARKQAKASLRERLELKVAPERVTAIARKVLIDKMTGDEKFRYIRTGIDEGLDKHENVAKVLGNMQHNFQQMVQALQDPHSVINNPKEMNKIASLMLDNAHNGYLASQYPTLQKNYDQLTEDVKVLATAYQELKRSAGGSTKGNRQTPTSAPYTSNGRATDTTEDTDKFKKFLSKQISLDELLKS